MTQKHLSELDKVAREIYDSAAAKINDYLQHEYGKAKGDSLDKQMEDFHLIAERATVYLMGNVVALLDESVEEECIAVQNKHLRSMVKTIRGMAQSTNGPLN